MKTIGLLLLAVAGALALIAAVVLGLGDRQVLVSPPEAVAEGFVRELASERFEQARPYLGEEVAARTNAAVLRDLTHHLKERIGSIEEVTGEPVTIRGDQAEAAARVRTARGETRLLRFHLSRQGGTWSIDDLDSLTSAT